MITSTTLQKIISAVFITLPLHVFAFTEQHIFLVYSLSVAVMLDSITGVVAAIVHKRLASAKLGRPMALKVFTYASALFTVLLLNNSAPVFAWTFTYLSVYLILGEVLSVFENISLLGFKTPVRIISALNEKYLLMQKEKK